MKIGFVGLGIMGNAMASNLVKGGFEVTVWNRSADKPAQLAEKGARVAGSPRAVAEWADIVITMMANAPAMRARRL